MKVFMSALIFLLMTSVTAVWSADSPNFRDNWLKLYKSDEERERSVAVQHLGFPWCNTKEQVANFLLLSREAVHDQSKSVRETALERLREAFVPNRSSSSGCGKIDDKFSVTLRSLLKDESPVVREEALRLLGLLQAENAVTDIAALLRDNSFTVRQEAAVALGRIGDQLALPYLLDQLNEQKQWQGVFVKQEVLHAIRKIVTARQRIYIRRSPKGDTSEERNLIDAEQLEKIKTAMIRAAADPYLKREVFEFFAVITTTGAGEILKSATSDPDQAIRKLAYAGISRLEANKPAKDNCGFENILRALQDQAPSIRASALEKLPDCRGQVDLTILSDHLVRGINDADPTVSNAAVAIAPSIGGSDMLSALAAKLGVEPYERRKRVRETFITIALGAKNLNVPAQTGAFKEIKRSHQRGDVKTIIAIEGEPPRAQGYAVFDGKNKTITAIQPPTAQEQKAAVDAAVDSDSALQAKAVEIILERFSALPLNGKTNALEVLGKLEDPRIRPFAISLLEDPSPEVRSFAIVLAKKIGNEVIVPQLFTSAQDKNMSLRYAAISALLDVEQLPEEYSLTRLASSPDPEVRKTLASQIKHYQGNNDSSKKNQTKFTELMLILLGDTDPDVRMWASLYFQANPDKRSIDILAKVLTAYGPCSYIAETLALQGDKRGNDALCEVAKGSCDTHKFYNRTNERRINAAITLGKVKDLRAVPLMCELLGAYKDNYSPPTLNELINELGATRDKEAAACLVSYGRKMKHGDYTLFNALGRIASPDSISFIKESLDKYQYNQIVYDSVVSALWKIPGTESLDAIIDMYLQEKPIRFDSYSHANPLVSRVRNDREALIYALLKAGKEPVRYGHVARSLIDMYGSTLNSSIIALAGDGDILIRKGAIVALGACKEKGAILTLKKLADDNDAEIKGLAKLSLERLGQ